MIKNSLLKPKAQSNFLVVGLARDCQKTLSLDISRLKKAIGEVKTLHWLLIESDSKDDTVVELNLQKKSLANFEYISLNSLETTYPRRLDRITHCRNVYLNRINSSSDYMNIDFVIVADFDNLNIKIDGTAIDSCWKTNIDWDMCAANQDGPYYDIWALRHKIWSPNDCWDQFEFLCKYSRNKRRNLAASVSSRMIRLPRDHDWVEVDSAFGGLAIYKKKMFKDCQYICRYSDGSKHCEHVYLHDKMKKNGYKLFINPKLINTNTTYHQKHANIYYRLLIKIKDIVRNIR